MLMRGAHRGKRRFRVARGAAHAFLLGWAIFTLFPILWVYTSALKAPEEVFQMPPKWFFRPTLHNFEVVFGLKVPTELEAVTQEQQLAVVHSKFPRYFVNSVIVSTGATMLSLTLGSLAAYSLTRFRWGNRKVILTGIILSRLVPPVTLIVPFYVLWRSLHLFDTHLGLILVYLTFSLPFSVWLMRSFFLEIPVELEEAAFIDGCSRMRAFLQVTIPLAAPGLATTAIFNLLLSWNEFLFAAVLTAEHARTLAPSILSYITDKAILWGRLYAAGATILLPVMLLALVVQKHLARGLATGALKG